MVRGAMVERKCNAPNVCYADCECQRGRAMQLVAQTHLDALPQNVPECKATQKDSTRRCDRMGGHLGNHFDNKSQTYWEPDGSAHFGGSVPSRG
jgi:hypothetical protein